MREMNSTGIVWCPSIPSDWEVRRVKDCFYISKVKAGTKNPVVLKLARSGVQVKDVTVNGGQMAESYDDYNPVQVGDLLLNPMDLYSGANCNVSEVEGVISPAYVNLRAKETLNPYYFDYYFKIQYWTMAMFAHGKGVSYDNRWTINAESVKAYELPFPSVSEQNAIVDIIKRKSTQIDALISNAQQQIEKLKAYKQSVITETVTKGLDPDVKMKDSGVEWIGEIPEHWKVIRLKFLLQYIIDCPHETPNYSFDGEYYVIRTADEDYGFLRADEQMYRLDEKEYKHRIRRLSLDKDDIVYGREGERWGLACIVPESNKYCLGQRMMQFRCNEHIVPMFIMWALNSKNIYVQGCFDTLGSTSPHVNISTIINYEIPIPSYEEQNKLASFLEEKCSQIDKLIALKQQKIEKLQQYKKSLIYEYVTGKKEV